MPQTRVMGSGVPVPGAIASGSLPRGQRPFRIQSPVGRWPPRVRIKYGVWTADGTFIEGSDDLTVYVDLPSSPNVIYVEIAHATLKDRNFIKMPPC